MSSSAMPTAESSNTPDRDLIIIPDGSPLWLTSDPDDKEQKSFGWRLDGISALMERLVHTSFPVLIGAPQYAASQLCPKHGDDWIDVSHPWMEWAIKSSQATSLRVMHRFPGTSVRHFGFGSKDPNATQVELRFVTEALFYTGTRDLGSHGWLSSLRQLGFDVGTWNTSLSLAQNLENKHITNAVPSATRPTNITLMSWNDGTLVNQRIGLT